MRKTNVKKLAALTLALSLCTTTLMSGTLAKYTSTATASDNITVASWELKLNDTEFTTASPAITFDLFNTVTDDGTTDGTTDDTNVVDGKIAPGTGGKFVLKVDNLSDVTATYNIVLTETNNDNIYIQYSTDGSTWTDDLTAVNTALGAQELAVTSGTDTNTVYWRWASESTGTAVTDYHTGQTDTNDTTLGIAGTATVSVSATITATQVD